MIKKRSPIKLWIIIVFVLIIIFKRDISGISSFIFIVVILFFVLALNPKTRKAFKFFSGGINTYPPQLNIPNNSKYFTKDYDKAIKDDLEEMKNDEEITSANYFDRTDKELTESINKYANKENEKEYTYRKIWWKDYTSSADDVDYDHGLIMDDKGLEYRGSKYPWGRIKCMYFSFSKSQKLAESLKHNIDQDFVPAGSRLFTILTGSAARRKKNHIRVTDVKSFIRVLRNKSMLHKLRKLK